MTQLTEKINALKFTQQSDNQSYLPVMIRLNNEKDYLELNEILDIPGISVHDEIQSQLAELIKIRHPGKKFNEHEIKEAVLKNMGEKPIEYGVWVYYPWSRRVVHIPDREEFIEIRTSRNLYKITHEERAILEKKRIGIIGLSVGQSVALTLIIERICGEIRLADFDTLELTNLNRIRTGIHNLGMHKVITAAREIAEIDPFINVKCYPKGATTDNIDEFFLGDGTLDLLIEESDGIDIKVLSRLKAKQYKIPVLMEASDRCMVDVERFDLDPNLGLLHGILDNLDMEKLKSLVSNEEKIPYMLDIAGLKTASNRIKASMLEIEQTINTWPQLASAVAMGGGITADVSRRILLNHYTESGRYHVDIEELIGNKIKNPVIVEPLPNYQYTDVFKLSNLFVINTSNERAVLTKDQIKIIIEAAKLAPSGGNYQPWFWVSKNNTMLLFNAVDANPVFLGYGNIASYIALGASMENAILKAKQMHFDSELTLFPDPAIPELFATVSFYPEKNKNEDQLLLASGIETRVTNRNSGIRTPIHQEILHELKNLAGQSKGVELDLFTSEEELNEMAEVLGELEKIRLIEKNGQRDFAEEIRWTEEENMTKRDGLDINTLDLTQSELAGLKIAQQKEVMDLIREWNGGNAFKKLTKKSIDSASAIAILSVPHCTPDDYFNGGRILERIWILANLRGLAFQPMSSSLFVYARLIQGNGIGISAEGAKKLWSIRPKFEQLFHIKPERGYVLIFRLGITDKPVVRSLRRPLESCFLDLE